MVRRNGSDISVCDDVNSNPIGYVLTDMEPFPSDDRDQLISLLAMKYVSPWDFSSAYAGWSGRERDCELCMEAILVDPSVA